MMDDGKPDDKIICVSTNDPRYLHTSDISDIEELDEEKAGQLIMAARNICWFNEE